MTNEPSNSGGEPAMKRVLIVDDETDVAQAMMMVLEPYYDVQSALSGPEALVLLESSPIDVIIVDLMMPVMSGKEFVTELHLRGIHVPVVVASASRDLRAACESLGVQRYLQKPYRLPALLQSIAGALSDDSGSSTPSGGGGPTGSSSPTQSGDATPAKPPGDNASRAVAALGNRASSPSAWSLPAHS